MPERLVFSAFLSSFKDLAWKEEVYPLAEGNLRHFSALLTKQTALWAVVLPSQEDVNESADPGGVRVHACHTDEGSFSITVWGTDPEETKLRAYNAGRKKFLEILGTSFGATLEGPCD